MNSPPKRNVPALSALEDAIDRVTDKAAFDAELDAEKHDAVTTGQEVNLSALPEKLPTLATNCILIGHAQKADVSLPDRNRVPRALRSHDERQRSGLFYDPVSR